MNFSKADLVTIAFDARDGLVPAIVQDEGSGAVLMLGYMNAAALGATLERGRVVFYSRSRKRLWEKGETSGHTLDLVEIAADCDADTLLVTARPRGPVCHKGCRTCFGDTPATSAGALAPLAALEALIARRQAERPEGSYTTRLLDAGPLRIAQKVGEEGVEVALAGSAESADKLVSEAADLLYHLLVLLRSRDVSLAAVVGALAARSKQ
ncbi:MAG: Histidine biosynthesis bifunctional protein HisIE [Steroidobacteraceae bacterium]|nr:Histidine biosynthesis bifunctional protein HisIE [Steroidobacteraceae bacterium]